MPNPIPAYIRRLTERPIEGKGDWVRRSRRARDLLIERHDYRADDFYEVGTDSRPCLGMSSLYPASWGRLRGKWPRRKRGRGLSFPFVQHFPCGLVLFNSGPDYWGEGSDDRDPILDLAECEHWGSLTDEDMQRIFEEDASA